jgi:hypothetical protein
MVESFNTTSELMTTELPTAQKMFWDVAVGGRVEHHHGCAGRQTERERDLEDPAGRGVFLASRYRMPVMAIVEVDL